MTSIGSKYVEMPSIYLNLSVRARSILCNNINEEGRSLTIDKRCFHTASIYIGVEKKLIIIDNTR
jgi:hypothetical protein